MADPVTAPRDQDLRVPLLWADVIGPVAPRAGGTVVTSSDATICSGADVAANDQSFVCRLVGDGVCTIDIDNPGPPDLHDSFQLTVAEPVPTSMSADTTHAVSVPKGSAA